MWTTSQYFANWSSIKWGSRQGGHERWYFVHNTKELWNIPERLPRWIWRWATVIKGCQKRKKEPGYLFADPLNEQRSANQVINLRWINIPDGFRHHHYFVIYAIGDLRADCGGHQLCWPSVFPSDIKISEREHTFPFRDLYWFPDRQVFVERDIKLNSTPSNQRNWKNFTPISGNVQNQGNIGRLTLFWQRF